MEKEKLEKKTSLKTKRSKDGRVSLKIKAKNGINEVRSKVDSYIKIPPQMVDKLTVDYVDDWGIERKIQPVNEQNDGTFLLSEDEFDLIKEDAGVKALRVDEMAKIKKKAIDSKPDELGL